MARLSGWLLKAGLPLAASVLVLSGCETEPTQPDPTQVKLQQLDQRVGEVERVVNNQSLVQLSQRIDQLDLQLRELRGEVEELQNNNDQLSKQQRDFYTDLNRRVGALEGRSVAGAGGPGGAAGNFNGTGGAAANATGAANGSPDQVAYQQAFDTLKTGNYAMAARQLMAFLQAYPHSDLADNAQYWLGEAYYVQRDYDDAASAFRAVGQNYPQSRKAPDALLKLGYTQLDQNKQDEGRATLNQVVQQYPNSDAAKLAMQRLTQISKAQ